MLVVVPIFNAVPNRFKIGRIPFRTVVFDPLKDDLHALLVVHQLVASSVRIENRDSRTPRLRCDRPRVAGDAVGFESTGCHGVPERHCRPVGVTADAQLSEPHVAFIEVPEHISQKLHIIQRRIVLPRTVIPTEVAVVPLPLDAVVPLPLDAKL